MRRKESGKDHFSFPYYTQHFDLSEDLIAVVVVTAVVKTDVAAE
jgi:hypothetical protein